MQAKRSRTGDKAEPIESPPKQKLSNDGSAQPGDEIPAPVSIFDLFQPLANAGKSGDPPVQRRSTASVDDPMSGVASTAEIAARGTAGPGSPLPYLERIQASFEHHDVTGVQAHHGTAATSAAHQLGAAAYAFGNNVAFGSSPDLHTAAHEAAHVVQQRGGVQLKGGIDQPGDEYERHADAVADAVVAGEPAGKLLDQIAGNASSAVQRASVQREPTRAWIGRGIARSSFS